MRLTPFAPFCAIAVCATVSSLVLASPGDVNDDDLALCKAITKAKASLSDGIRQSARTETPISAKLERDDRGALSLSVYTAGKGLGVHAEANVLREWVGPPDGGRWAPRAETFKDVEHVARASEQLTLMALTTKTLAEIATKAEKEPFGSPFSITPVLAGRRAYFEVRYLDKGRINEVRYDLLTGDKM
jgi:hypothetical protein